MNGPVVKMYSMVIIEEDLRIELVLTTDILEIHHFLHPNIPARIPICFIVDYPVFWDVVMKILCVVLFLMNYHRWYEALSIISGENEIFAPEWCSLCGLGLLHPASSE